MNGLVSKLARCAIYTRKSSEHNLDLAFTSLDAQREACEAYIKESSARASKIWGQFTRPISAMIPVPLIEVPVA
jgi:hypothetical protein